jgi:hypothetical protein
MTEPNEPVYADPDDPFGDQPKKGHYKWQTPSSPLGRRILKAVGRTYLNTRTEQSRLNVIAKSSLPLAAGVIARYPEEWIDCCIAWVKTQRRKGKMLNLSALLSAIENKDRMQDFLAKVTRKTPVQSAADDSDDLSAWENNP